jgi:molybdopterin biosynthesis enzyme MoaB
LIGVSFEPQRGPHGIAADRLVSISDRASSGVYEDKGIPGLNEWFTAALNRRGGWRAG